MSITKKWLKGTGVALVTPFKDGQVDYPALETLVNHCVNGKVEHLVVLGTTGESATLSTQEQHKVLDFVIEKNAGRAGIIAGFGGSNTEAVVEAIQAYHFKGVDAILSSSPAYNKPSQEGIYQHYMRIAEVAPKPIIIYNVPGRTASNISAHTTLRLAASEKFIGIKEASADLRQVMEILKYRPPHFAVLSGDDPLTLPMMALGAEGVISVIANAYPAEYSEMVRQAAAENYDEARRLHYLLIDLIDLLFKEGNPAGIKAALQIRNICGQELRLPLTPISEGTYQAMLQRMERIRTQK